MEQYIMKNQKQLRLGITTGTCAAAAAKAAASLLLLGIKQETVRICTPKGMTVSVPVFLSLWDEKKAEYKVIKDSGDDPDVTNHTEIAACVEKIENDRKLADGYFHTEQYPFLYIEGGDGVGRITKSGLEQEIGQAAINAVPRSMIFQSVDEICRLAEYETKLLITISVPAGKKLAQRTFNPKLGIEGGISILGTSGILEPMSERAIIDTIEVQIKQLGAQGTSCLLVTPGNYGQGYAADYLQLDMEKSIKCSNYIGDTLDLAAVYGMREFLLVGNIGKLVKLAAGIMNTHSKTADGRCEIMALHTILCGGTRRMAEEIMECVHTEEILKLLVKWSLAEAVISSLCGKIEEHMRNRGNGRIRCGAVLFSEKMGYLGETESVQEMLEKFRNKGE